MHLPREPTLVAHEAPETTHTTLSRRRVRAAMAVNADEVVAGRTVVTSRLARDRLEDLELGLGGRVIVEVIAALRGPFAAVGVEVVHVAHLDLLDALQFVPVEVERRVDALALLVVAADRHFDCAWDFAGLRERSDVLCTLGPGFRNRDIGIRSGRVGG